MKKYSLFIIGLFFLLVGCLEDETTFGDQEIWTVDTVYLTDLNTGNKQKVNQGAMASFYSDPGKEFQIAAHDRAIDTSYRCKLHHENSVIPVLRFGAFLSRHLY